ncbi:serpentine type 7TM GPCR chemoreceptor srh domain-containing protein [Ditylenchus destructor]|nr:serpentine type 7TM GPCR chemoreceptor srh domain-containing protein [Ditylenchus destructor]
MSSEENTLPDDEEYNIALLIITSATILLQCYVIFIIIYVSPKSMSDFRYFLCFISIWDLIFTALLGYGLHPTFLFPLSAGQINGLFKYLGPTGANIGASIAYFIVATKSKPDAVIIALDFNRKLPIGINTVRYCAAVIGGVIFVEFFTLVLAFQFVSPLFVLVPLSMLMIQAVMGSPAFDRSTGKTGIVLLSIYTLSNSLVTVLFVTPYRKLAVVELNKHQRKDAKELPDSESKKL